MPYELPPLPYDADALEPFVSLQTMKLHYGKHHQGYVDTLNAVTKGTRLDGKDLETIMLSALEKSDRLLFNNAAQVWNHNFFWNSMVKAPSAPSRQLKAEIDTAFGGIEGFNRAFKDAATGQFGSGWTWLLAGRKGLEVMSTPNADTPVVDGQCPLLCCDVWEHAYYLDYQNERGAFVDVFLESLINWDFASENFAAMHTPLKVANG